MIDGYYLSTNMKSNELNTNPWGVMKSATLWYKEESTVRILQHWNIEGVQDGESKQFIDKVFNRKNLSYRQVKILESTPTAPSPSETFSSLSQKQLDQILPTLLCEPEKFYQDTIIILALDKFSASVRLSTAGDLKVNKILSLTALWETAEDVFHMNVQKLFDIAISCDTKLPDEQLSPITSLKTSEAVCDFVRNLIKDMGDFESTELYNDSRFSYHQHKMSMYMKVFIDASKKIIEIELESIIDTMEISCSEIHLAMTGNHPLNSVLMNSLNHKYGFKSILTPPCIDHDNGSFTDGLRIFFNETPKLRIDLNSPQITNEDDNDTDIFESLLYAPYIHSLQSLTPETFVRDIIEDPILCFDSSPHNTVYNYANACILMDPRSTEQCKKMNTFLHREWWQPITAIVLDYEVAKWYKNPLNAPAVKQVLKINPTQAEKIPAVNNQHNWSTVEVLTPALNPRLFSCIQQFESETKTPLFGKVVLQEGNWSPIKTAKGALDLSIRKKLHVLYINGVRIQLHNHDKYFNNVPLWV